MQPSFVPKLQQQQIWKSFILWHVTHAVCIFSEAVLIAALLLVSKVPQNDIRLASNIFAMCLSFENCEISWESVRFITWPPYWILKWLLMALVVLQEGRVSFGWVSRYCLMLPFKCCSSGRANQNLRIALINTIWNTCISFAKEFWKALIDFGMVIEFCVLISVYCLKYPFQNE